MDTITPHLWFDKEAREAAEFYTALFDRSRTGSVVTLPDTPSGPAELVTIELAGQEFTLLSAGPLFKFNPSVSFRVDCATIAEVDKLAAALVEGGSALMELGEYPFSARYAWLQDRYGLSWQVMFRGDRAITQKITPMLMFVGDVCGRAEEAITFYTSVFHRARVGDMFRYGKDEAPDKEGTVKQVDFTLEGQQFAAMDSAHPHDFAFNEAISLMVYCDTQDEIDYYWGKLSAVPEAEQCGWLKDRFGLSWQVVPRGLDEALDDTDEERRARVMQAVLGMKKLDLAELQAAHEGRLKSPTD